MKRIIRPESVLAPDDIDRHKVTTVLGKGTAQAMKARRCYSSCSARATS